MTRITATLATRLTDAEVAEIIHAANDAYNELRGERSCSWADAPHALRQSVLAGVAAVRAGAIKTPEQAHEAWCAYKYNAGWTYGAEKSAVAKTHPCLMDYWDLPPDQQRKDALFFALCGVLL